MGWCQGCDSDHQPPTAAPLPGAPGQARPLVRPQLTVSRDVGLVVWSPRQGLLRGPSTVVVGGVQVSGVRCRWRGGGDAPDSDRVPAAGGESGPCGSQEAAQAGQAHPASGLAEPPHCQGRD